MTYRSNKWRALCALVIWAKSNAFPTKADREPVTCEGTGHHNVLVI